jgi:hypothetical protein
VTSSLIYTDPFSGIEVLLLNHSDPTTKVGVAYDPRSTSLPVPFYSLCPHCAAGRQQGMSVHTRREVMVLLSAKQVLSKTRKTRRGRQNEICYTLPTNEDPTVLLCWQKGSSRHALARTGGRELLITRPDDTSKLVYDGDRREFQSPILQRCLRFLWSSRTATPSEISAILLPLRGPRRPQRGRASPCHKVDWNTLTGGAT